MEDPKKKKNVTTVAIVAWQLLFKTKKVAHQNCTVDEQCNTLCEQWPNTVTAQLLFIQLIEIDKKVFYCDQ